MTTQPDPNQSWSWAVQRELDGLKNDVATHIGSSVSSAEYIADKRTTEFQLNTIKDKIDDVESDIAVVKTDLVKSVDELKTTNAAEHSRLEKAIHDETAARQTQAKEDVAARQSQFRWMISAVLIPIVLAIMDLLLNKK